MTPTSPTPPLRADDAGRKLSELRPLASTSRLMGASMCLLVILSPSVSVQPWIIAVVLSFMLWASHGIWAEVTGRGDASRPAGFAMFIACCVLVARTSEHAGFLLPVLVHPLVMLSLLHSLKQGMVAGAFAAIGLVLDLNPPGLQTQWLLPALGLLLIPPATWFLARPVAVLRQRIQLAAELEHQLDPRRGVQSVGLAIATRLRQVTGAHQVVLCHRNAELSTVLVADQDDNAYVATHTLAGPLLQALAELPPAPAEIGPRAPADGTSPPQKIDPARQLADLLGAHHLQLVPDTPGDALSAWLLVAYGPQAPRQARPWMLRALAAFALDMRRLVQQASYVDSLQAEIAAHERARIGRDLHDSALQPYLGLKFAIEVVAQRCAPDNPLHASVQDLRQFCETELNELRDTVALLRTGEVRGDNTLVPALRRQAKRFAALFGIQITLQVPDELVTSRALSGAVLHMVNEAVNNVRRHTQARNVWVSLKPEANALHLRVRDDAGQRNGQPAPAFEPRSLTERARELGGTLAVQRPNGLDTEVHIAIPI